MRFFGQWRHRWANLHVFWQVSAILVVVLGLAACIAPPALAAWRSWSAARDTRTALAAGAAGDHSVAREAALRVLRHDPGRAEVLPVFLKAARALGDPKATDAACQLLIRGTSLPLEDRRDAWEFACRTLPGGPLAGLRTTLTATEREDARFVGPWVERMIRDGMRNQAADALDSHPRPLPPDLQVALMRLLLASGGERAHRIFQENLIERARADAETGAALLPLLDEIPQPSLLPELASALAGLEPAMGEEVPLRRLRLARCEMAARPIDADFIFTEALRSHADADPAFAARWCIHAGRPEMALELLERLPGDVEGFDARRFVLERTGDMAAWADALDPAPPGADSAEIHCDRAFIAAQSDDRPAREAAEEQAIRSAEASLSPEALVQLARRAEFRGLKSLARRAWLEAIRRRKGPLPPGERLKPFIESLAESRRESELLEVLTSYRAMEPENPMFVVQHAYVSCLMGHAPPSRLIADLEPILQRLPENVPVRFSLALGHLLEGDADPALPLTDPGGRHPESFQPACRIIRATALIRAGEVEEAVAWLEDVDWERLLPSEKRVFRQLLEAGSGTAKAR